MANQEFIKQLKELGHNPEEIGDDKVSFSFTIPVGKFAGQQITLGFVVPPDFPSGVPSGIHISPQILPLNPNASGHPEKVADSPFGSEWEYWSRPMHHWANTQRNVKEVMRYVNKLFLEQ